MATVRVLGHDDEAALLRFLRSRSDTTMFMQSNLARAGIELATTQAHAPLRCAPPTRAHVRQQLDSCRFLQGGRGRVLVRAHRGHSECRVDTRWVPLARERP